MIGFELASTRNNVRGSVFLMEVVVEICVTKLDESNEATLRSTK